MVVLGLRVKGYPRTLKALATKPRKISRALGETSEDLQSPGGNFGRSPEPWEAAAKIALASEPWLPEVGPCRDPLQDPSGASFE